MATQTYQNTEIEAEQIKLPSGDLQVWIELQCHNSEFRKGWAFRFGGSAVYKTTEWRYGYASKENARKAAVCSIKMQVESIIQSAKNQVSLFTAFLDEVQDLQDKSNT